MTTSRKTAILNKIIDETRQGIIGNDYNFNKCNAYDIALDFNIDRSNISRILNQLFNEFQLIKISGRPTTYLSRDVIVNEFRFTKVPQVLNDKESLQQQLLVNNPMTNGLKINNINIIGSANGESLQQLVEELIPFFILPQNTPLLIIAYGDRGAGKKYFFETLFNYSLKHKSFPKNSKFVIINYNDFKNNNTLLSTFINPSEMKLIIIEFYLFIEENILFLIRNYINGIYSNANKQFPIIVFTFNEKSYEKNAYENITPIVIPFPSFAERTNVEKIKLVLTFIQESSNKNNTHLRISNRVLIKLLSANYKYNIIQLKDELFYAISKSIYFSRNNYAIILPEFFSKLIRHSHNKNQRTEEEIENLFEHSLPTFLDFIPNEECKLIESISLSNSPSIILPKTKQTLVDKVKTDVLKCNTDLNQKIIQSRIQLLLTPILSRTKLIHDIPIINKLYLTLEEMVHGTFNLDDYTEDYYKSDNTHTIKLYNSILEKMESAYEMSFPLDYREYIKCFLSYSYESLNKNQIIYILINHEKQTTRNYAKYLNFISDSRSFYSIDYPLDDALDSFKQYTKKVISLIETMDDSKEIAIISDKTEIVEISKFAVAKLNRPILSLYPISVPLLLKAISIMKAGDIHIVSLTKKLIEDKKEISKSLTSIVEELEHDYINKIIGSNFEMFFTTNNIILTNKVLFSILKDVCNSLNIIVTLNLTIEFLLHGNFMIS
ncbi:MAG: hypothetical protein RR734_03810, partial [Bacilli bacterium]